MFCSYPLLWIRNSIRLTTVCRSQSYMLKKGERYIMLDLPHPVENESDMQNQMYTYKSYSNQNFNENLKIYIIYIFVHVSFFNVFILEGKHIRTTWICTFFLNQTFPRFPPCKTGWRKARERLIYKKVVQIQTVLKFLSH